MGHLYLSEPAMPSTTLIDRLCMMLSMLLSGTIGWAVTASGQAPATVVLFRCLIGATALGCWLLLRRQWQPLRRAALGWILSGGLALSLNWLALFSAYHYSSLSVVTLVYHLQPLLLLILAARWQREALPAGIWGSLLLALSGVLLTSKLTPGDWQHTSWQGPLLAALAALLYAVATLFIRQVKHVPPAQVATLQLGFSSLLFLPAAFKLSSSALIPSLPVLLLLGLLHTAGMYLLMYRAFQRLPAAEIAMLSYLYPVTTLLVDQQVFHVQLSAGQWLGVGLILLALLRQQHLQRKTQPSG